MALTTAAGYKTRNGITVSTYDSALAVVLTDAEQAVASWCKRTLETTGSDVTEYYDGTGTDTILLNMYPITSVTSVSYMSGVTSGAADYTAYGTGEYYTEAATGKLIFFTSLDWAFPDGFTSTSGWPIGTANIKVVYKAGYTSSTVPADLAGAIYDLMGLLMQARDGTREDVTEQDIDAFLRDRIPSYRRQTL